MKEINVTATYNWDTWKTDINGATVTLDFKRVGDRKKIDVRLEVNDTQVDAIIGTTALQKR